MDDIKTNIEKIFDDFSDDLSHSAIPKRLSFDYMNSSYEINRKKRKLSELNDSSVVEVKSNDEKNTSTDSLNSAIISSPWEARRMKADLIEAKSRITLLKKEIEHQNTVHVTSEHKRNHQISSLEKQLSHNTSKVTDLEKHLSVLRKRESSAKEELVKAKNQLQILKQSTEDKIFTLQRENKELEENLTYTSNELNTEIRELNQQLMETEEQLSMTQEEVETYKELNETMQEKSDSYDACKKELEEVREKLSETESKVKSLEYEVGSYGDWKNLSKASLSRLSNLSELEKEVTRLREESKNLHDTIGNKMLLEEQVADLKSRLERNEKEDTDTVELKFQVTTLEKELKNWKQCAAEFCPAKSAITPVVLRSHIEQILQKDLILTNEKSLVKTENNQVQTKMIDIKTENDQLIKQTNDLKRSLKYHQNIFHRVQKKLQLVASERDCFKNLLDNYEKDLTITSTSTMNNTESQIRARMEMLEKTVSGYKDLCAKLEGELQAVKTLPDMSMDSAFNNEQYERLRKEIDSLTAENGKLKKRKDELELELENFTLRAEINRDRYKIVHFTENPASEAYESHKNEIEKLQAEIERLKKKNRKLEEGNEELTVRLNDTNMTMNVKDLNSLRTQIQSLEAKNQHVKEIYKAASQEFREVCYMLFGYRVDRVGNTNYRISSMYAESEEEYLNFRLNESGSVLNMLETQYSESLADMMGTHLATHGSLPAFLSSLTLELFNKTTVMVQS